MVTGDCARQSRGEVLTIDDLANKSSLLARVGSSPKGITVDPNNKVYVANQLSDNISVINGNTGSILYNITLQGGRPIEILYNSFNHHIYVTNGFKNSVDVIDGKSHQVIKSIDVGDIPNGITFNPSNGDVYVTHSSKNSVDVIDGKTNEVIDTALVGENPTYIAYNNLNNNLYVSNQFGNVTVLKVTR
jgi:YVTN family beta-propeller protein